MHLNKDYLTPDLYTFVSKKRLLVYCTSCTGAVAVGLVVVTAGASGAAGAPSWSIWTSGRWPIRGMLQELRLGVIQSYRFIPYTLPKFDMEPENDGFQVRNLLFQGAIFR